MLELQAGIGFGGAAKRFYDDHRTFVLSVALSVAGVASGAACAAAIAQGVSLSGIAVMALAVMLAGAVSFWQTRYPVLAAVAALAPVPGLLWAAPISGGSEFATVPVLAYGLGFAVAALSTEARITKVLDLPDAHHPWRAAVLALFFSAIMAVLWFHDTASADAALQAVADGGLAVLSVLALLPLAHDLIRCDEGYVAQANRTHERRRRFWERLAAITTPRWALSFTGIAIVMLALGWYGSGPMLREGMLARVGSVLLTVIGAAVYARNWREGIATGLIWSMAGLLALWAIVVGHRPNFAPVAVLQISTLAALLTFYGLRRARMFAKLGDPPVIAYRRTLEQAGGQGFASAGAASALVPAMVVFPGSTALVFGVVVACGAAIMLMPAASISMDLLLPRRRSVEELYRKSGTSAR